MSRKKKAEQSAPVTKSIQEMTDHEFLTNIDSLYLPYYQAYLRANSHPELREGDLVYNPYGNVRYQPTYAENPPIPPVEVKSSDGKKSKKGKRKKLYEKKRPIPLLIIAIISLLTVAIILSGLIGFCPLYNIPESEEMTSITATDTIVGLVKGVVNLEGTESIYFDKFLQYDADKTEIMTKIALYAVPVAALLTLVFAVIAFFKALVALFSRRKDNFYHKFKFGFFAIVSFLCGLIFVMGGLYVAGINLADVADFLFAKSEVMQAGYAIYPLVLLPIVSFVMNCLSYKKQK